MLPVSIRQLNHYLSDTCVNILWLICALFPEIYELGRFQTANMILKVSQGHRCWCHSTGNIWFPVCFPLHVTVSICLPLLWHCWLGGRKGIQPVKK